MTSAKTVPHRLKLPAILRLIVAVGGPGRLVNYLVFRARLVSAEILELTFYPFVASRMYLPSVSFSPLHIVGSPTFRFTR